MTAFKVGDKVTHPLTGDNVLTVVATSLISKDWIKADVDALPDSGISVYGLIRPIAEFTAYVPPRVSTQELANRLSRAWDDLSEIHDWRKALVPAQALAEAATAYAERLEEESRMIEQRMKSDGTMVPTFVLPPLSTTTGEYPTLVLGCTFTALGQAAQK